MFGGKNKFIKKNKGAYYGEEAYLDSRLSKGEAERRAWKALSFLMTNDRVRQENR